MPRSTYIEEGQPLPVYPPETPVSDRQPLAQPYRVFFRIRDGILHVLPKRLIRDARVREGVLDRSLNTAEQRFRKAEEINYARNLMIEAAARRQPLTTFTSLPPEAAPYLETIIKANAERRGFVQDFELVVRLFDSIDQRDSQRSIEYGLRFVDQGIEEEMEKRAQETFKALNPYDLIVNRPLEHLSGPTAFVSPDHWWAIRGLIEAAAPFYTPGAFVDLPHERFADYLFEKLQSGDKKDKQLLINAVKLIARVRDADCQYYEKLFFAEQANPRQAIANIATFYEKTLANLHDRSTSKDVEDLSAVLEEESQMLRIIQAQDYRFTTYDRPVDPEVVLLPVAIYLGRQVQEDFSTGKDVDYQKYAREIVSAFRSHRCSLTNDDVFRICRFFSGAVQQRRIEASNPFSTRVPWLVLRQTTSATQEQIRFDELFAAMTETDQKSGVCSALSKIDLDLGLMRQIVPDLLFEFRRQGYFQGVKQTHYDRLGVDDPITLFKDHEARLAQIVEEKKKFFLKEGDILGIQPMSGWTITNAHHDMATSAQRLLPWLVRRQEIRSGQALKDRNCVILFSLGDIDQEKRKLGMAPVEERVALTREATKYDPGIYVLDKGDVEEARRRSIRVKQLLAKLRRDNGITFSIIGTKGHIDSNNPYPGGKSVAALIGATEKLGSLGDQVATQFVLEAHKPDQDINFLNRLMQVMGILAHDISQPVVMTKFVLGLLENFQEPGILLLATRSAELHSTQTARTARDYLLARDVKGDEARAKRAQLSFKTMIDAPIWDRGWQMMLSRASALLNVERTEKVELWYQEQLKINALRKDLGQLKLPNEQKLKLENEIRDHVKRAKAVRREFNAIVSEGQRKTQWDKISKALISQPS